MFHRSPIITSVKGTVFFSPLGYVTWRFLSRVLLDVAIDVPSVSFYARRRVNEDCSCPFVEGGNPSLLPTTASKTILIVSTLVFPFGV